MIERKQRIARLGLFSQGNGMLKMHSWLFDFSLNSIVRILGSKLQSQGKENEDQSFRQGGALVALGQKLEDRESERNKTLTKDSSAEDTE